MKACPCENLETVDIPHINKLTALCPHRESSTPVSGTLLAKDKWPHKVLVRRLSNWLKNTKRLTVVMTELTTRNSETPDVIGWVGGASSILIECKASRADFLADGKKCFRRDEERGMGDVRYLATPPNLVEPDEIPEGWGLLEVHEHCVVEVKEPKRKEGNKRNECVMLMSALRRLEIATAVYVVADEDTANATPHAEETIA